MLLLALVAAASHATTLAGGGRVPPWPPTWQMNLSTIIQPCNSSGYFDPEAAAQWGVIDFDWSNAKELWANSKPMDTNERLLAQAAAVKRASGGRTKVFIYRNLVKALPWFTQVREKLEDPRYAGWFLRFKGYRGAASNHSYHVPACTDDKCSGCASPPPPHAPRRTPIGTSQPSSQQLTQSPQFTTTSSRALSTRPAPRPRSTATTTASAPRSATAAPSRAASIFTITPTSRCGSGFSMRSYRGPPA